MMRRGLTLVELLVSLAIIGLISAMLASGLGVAHKTRMQLDRARNDGDDVVAVQNMLRTLIEQLYPLNTSSGNPIPRIDVYGDGRRVVFLSSPIQAKRPDALYRYQLSLRANGDLVLSSASTLSIPLALANDDPKGNDFYGDTAWRDQVLLRGVSNMTLSYFGRSPLDGKRAWLPQWGFQQTAPELIRITVRFRRDDPREWPDFIARPTATLDTACSVDPRSGQCRGR